VQLVLDELKAHPVPEIPFRRIRITTGRRAGKSVTSQQIGESAGCPIFLQRARKGGAFTVLMDLNRRSFPRGRLERSTIHVPSLGRAGGFYFHPSDEDLSQGPRLRKKSVSGRGSGYGIVEPLYRQNAIDCGLNCSTFPVPRSQRPRLIGRFGTVGSFGLPIDHSQPHIVGHGIHRLDRCLAHRCRHRLDHYTGSRSRRSSPAWYKGRPA